VVYGHTGELATHPQRRGLSAVLTALAPSVSKTTFDINVWATVDGVSTAMLPIWIDTPVSITASAPVNQAGGCGLRGFPPTWTGYVTSVTNSIIDLSGIITLTKIDLNETLENQKFLQSPTTWTTFPTAGVWTVVKNWNTNTQFIDQLSQCGFGPNVPPIVSYNLSATTPGLSETQKFWVGSQTHYSGECVKIDALQLNSGFPTLTSETTPGSTPAQQKTCGQGQSIKN